MQSIALTRLDYNGIANYYQSTGQTTCTNPGNPDAVLSLMKLDTPALLTEDETTPAMQNVQNVGPILRVSGSQARSQ